MWEKLNDFVPGQEFSIWRPDIPEKMNYYRKQIGQKFAIMVKNRPLGYAMLMSVGDARDAMSFSDEEIAKDTFSDWTRKEWSEWLVKTYGRNDRIRLRELHFRVVEQ